MGFEKSTSALFFPKCQHLCFICRRWGLLKSNEMCELRSRRPMREHPSYKKHPRASPCLQLTTSSSWGWLRGRRAVTRSVENRFHHVGRSIEESDWDNPSLRCTTRAPLGPSPMAVGVPQQTSSVLQLVFQGDLHLRVSTCEWRYTEWRRGSVTKINRWGNASQWIKLAQQHGTKGSLPPDSTTSTGVQFGS